MSECVFRCVGERNKKPTRKASVVAVCSNITTSSFDSLRDEAISRLIILANAAS